MCTAAPPFGTLSESSFLRITVVVDAVFLMIVLCGIYCRKRASAQCKFPPECFQLYGDNVLLPDDATYTAGSTMLFNLARRLELDETGGCGVLVDKYRAQQESKAMVDET